MKRSCHVLAAALLLTAGGCGAADSAKGGPDSTASVADRLQFESIATERLAATRARLDSLQRELPRTADEFQTAMRVRTATLVAERDSAARRLAALKAAADDEWVTMRLAVADVLDSLERRLDRLSDELRRSARDARPRR